MGHRRRPTGDHRVQRDQQGVVVDHEVGPHRHGHRQDPVGSEAPPQDQASGTPSASSGGATGQGQDHQRRHHQQGRPLPCPHPTGPEHRPHRLPQTFPVERTPHQGSGQGPPGGGQRLVHGDQACQLRSRGVGAAQEPRIVRQHGRQNDARHQDAGVQRAPPMGLEQPGDQHQRPHGHDSRVGMHQDGGRQQHRQRPRGRRASPRDGRRPRPSRQPHPYRRLVGVCAVVRVDHQHRDRGHQGGGHQGRPPPSDTPGCQAHRHGDQAMEDRVGGHREGQGRHDRHHRGQEPVLEVAEVEPVTGPRPRQRAIPGQAQRIGPRVGAVVVDVEGGQRFEAQGHRQDRQEGEPRGAHDVGGAIRRSAIGHRCLARAARLLRPRHAAGGSPHWTSRAAPIARSTGWREAL